MTGSNTYRPSDNLYRANDTDKGRVRVSLRERVAARMKERGMVRADGEPNANALREATKLGYATAHGILSGTIKEPSKTTLEKLASGLGTTVDWLLAEDYATGTFEQGAEFVVRLMREAIGAAEEEIRRQRKRGAAPMPPGSWQYIPRPEAEGANEPGEEGGDQELG
jgi:transcriptional regulator with XRE-family HTH domain